jgi:hypothetical protein
LNYKQRYHLHQSSFQKFIVILFGSWFFFSSKLFYYHVARASVGLDSMFLHFFISFWALPLTDIQWNDGNMDQKRGGIKIHTHTGGLLTYQEYRRNSRERCEHPRQTEEEDTKVVLRSAELLALQKKRVSKAQARKQKMATTRSLARCTRERDHVSTSQSRCESRCRPKILVSSYCKTQHPHPNPDVVPNV